MARTIEEQVNILAKGQKRKVGFGLREENDEILESLETSKEFADIILVTPKELPSVNGFEVVSSEEPERTLAKMLVDGTVDGIVRGTIDDFKTLEAYIQLTGVSKEEAELAPAIVKDAHERIFFIYPVSNPVGWDVESKLRGVDRIVEYMKGLDIVPKVGVLTGERHDTYARKKEIKDGIVGILNKTYEDADAVVKYLEEKGVEAKNYAIEINGAADDGCNVIVPANGMLGNQIIRSVVFLGGGKILYGPRITLSHPYEDNSRNEADYTSHVKFVVAWANSINGKYRGKE